MEKIQGVFFRSCLLTSASFCLHGRAGSKNQRLTNQNRKRNDEQTMKIVPLLWCALCLLSWVGAENPKKTMLRAKKTTVRAISSTRTEKKRKLRKNKTTRNDCTPVEFRITFDEFPSEISFKLICDKEVIWNAPKGTFKPKFYQHKTHKQRTCISSAKSCRFVVRDNSNFKDGMSSPQNNLPGSLLLTVGSNTILDYDGGDKESSKFKKLVSPWFCVGDGCLRSNCVHVRMKLRLDEFPGESAYRLTCGRQLIWNKPTYSFLVRDQFSHGVVKDEACVDRRACCEFTLFDEYGDGITSPQDDFPGRLALKYNDKMVAKYNGAKGEQFNKKTFRFGRCTA